MDEAYRRMYPSEPHATDKEAAAPREFDGLVWEATGVDANYLPTSIRPKFFPLRSDQPKPGNFAVEDGASSEISTWQITVSRSTSRRKSMGGTGTPPGGLPAANAGAANAPQGPPGGAGCGWEVCIATHSQHRFWPGKSFNHELHALSGSQMTGGAVFTDAVTMAAVDSTQSKFSGAGAKKMAPPTPLRP